jgi:large subunit ribosomal protein L18
MKVRTRQEYRKRRHLRLRQKIRGTAERPRMAVYVSNRHIFVQFVDDDASRTLASASTQDEAFEGAKARNAVASAQKLGKMAATVALGKGIKKVVFDRCGVTYGGRLRALADAARGEGLQF